MHDTETTQNQRTAQQEQTIITADADKRARVRTLLSVPDFVLSASVIVATYDADIRADGTWNMILDVTGADVEIALTMEAE